MSLLADPRIVCCLLLLSLAGCIDEPAPPDSVSEETAEMGGAFDGSASGEIGGRVTWQGAIPKVPSYVSPLGSSNEHVGPLARVWPNPHQPHIQRQSKSVAGAVVFLRGIDPSRAHDWDLPPVRVELRDLQIHVCQGESDASTGFVRRGDSITMVSRQNVYHTLCVRGAAFFARAFADRDHPCTRRLDRAGLVELSSGCGYFWMRGWLVVVDHPYYTRSDAEGRFTLTQVPPGRYELAVWLPDWHEQQRDLDGDSALLCRLTFRPPIEVTQSIVVGPGQKQTLSLSIPAERFGP